MASLSDDIDRLTRSANAIRATASRTAAHDTHRPFTTAVLDRHLAHLIRDVDPSELGLFRLLDPSPRLARVRFAHATPLRRTASRRDDHARNSIDPDVYAQAAIKYIDRYDAIRPMPRARAQASVILQSIDNVRQNIRVLLHSLDQVKSVSDQGHPLKSLIEREENRANERRAKIADLQQRKQAALARHKPLRHKPTTQREQPASRPSIPAYIDAQPTPITAAKALHFTDNLLDEVMDFSHSADISMTAHIPDPLLVGEGVAEHSTINGDEAQDQQDDPAPINNAPAPVPDDSPQADPPEKGSLQPQRSNTTEKLSTQAIEETERITTKIWQTVADLLNSNHQLNALECPPASAAPSAQQILARLKLLSQLQVSPMSPSGMSETTLSTMAASHPSSQQILTAHLLLILLSAPHCALPLNKVKENLAVKAGSGQSTSRVIYGCVAKRLVKIDRSGREQIVKFDI
ncbi:hypothetical protein APHAL10511_000080 [Amanita phalloides]|nr:hypothetical protein APHAL10511_000080 [Amanita phalloides]